MKHLKGILPILALTLLVTIIWLDDEPDFVGYAPEYIKEKGVLTSAKNTVQTPSSASDGSSRRAFGLLAETHKIDLSTVELPSSLRGTDVDGGFRVDEQGNLIVELGIKRYFDYFMATVGEVSLAEINATISHSISTQLQEPARSQALSILEDYLSYKAAIHELEREYGQGNGLSFDEHQLPALARRLEALVDLRRAYLADDVVDAFFSEEEAVDRYTLSKLNILHDGALSSEQKISQIAELDSLLPDDVRQQKAEASQYQRYSMEEAKLRNNNAPSNEIHLLRVKEFGEEGAARLAVLDSERSVWEQRLVQYRLEEKQLNASGLSPQDITQQLRELRGRHFSVIEVRRVNALDRIGMH